MQSEKMSDTSLSVSDKTLEKPKVIYEDGTYEATYDGMSVFMDSTFGTPKKAARFYFQFFRGKYKGLKTSWKGNFVEDPETHAWVVGNKTKLASAIKNITGGKTIDESCKGRKVFIKVEKKNSKKDGHEYSLVTEIIPMPSDDDGAGEEAARMATPPQAQTVVRPQVQTVARTVAAPKPAAKPVVPPASEEAGGGLLDSLTELSDFKE